MGDPFIKECEPLCIVLIDDNELNIILAAKYLNLIYWLKNAEP